MKYHVVLGAITMFALTLTSPAIAGFIDGNELYKDCAKDRAFIVSYVAGVIDKQEVDVLAALNLRMAASSLKGAENEWFIRSFNHISIGSCVPENVTLKQLGDVVCKWLGANPDARHDSAAVLIGRAFSSSWQCKKTN